MTVAVAVALCLAVLSLAGVACFALWAMWGTIKALRATLYDQSRAQQALQARFLALEFERAGAKDSAAAALDQARPASHQAVYPPPPPEAYDEIGELAGSLG